MSDTKSFVSFSCQRCLQPLKLDESLNNLGEHTIADLTLQIRRNNEADLDLQSSSLEHYVPPFRMSESGNGANGFMVISDGWETTSLGHQLHVKATLFDLLSNNSDVDHPLCDECTDTLLELMDNQLRLTENEWKDYTDYLKKLEDDKEDLNLDGLEKELEDWKQEQNRLLQELSALQKEEKAMKDEIVVQEKEKERLEVEQDIYWKEYTRYRKDLMTTEDQMKFYECQLSYTQAQLEKLKKTNIFKATFHISDSGQFGIINNFRLGRLPTAPVDWSEINAAWGQTVLLLSSLARKINFHFQRYRLVPYGNHSYIEILEDQKVLPLYGSSGFRFLWDTKFDAAMVAFLDCLQQFKEQVEKGNTGFCLPYRIDTDKWKIEDTASPPHAYSIKIQFNSEEQWTKALKYMLTNLKWALTWISSQFSEDKVEG
ncbi:beclin-1-like protein [Maniola hyperantus]|uniref:beclin-1-like protein n=1 Tax=Aphantopus hyperantus TaxID=2795564 RepID=UPI001568A814|nr:beclin-1-like protein [Maniola hyperantus]